MSCFNLATRADTAGPGPCSDVSTSSPESDMVTNYVCRKARYHCYSDIDKMRGSPSTGSAHVCLL